MDDQRIQAYLSAFVARPAEADANNRAFNAEAFEAWLDTCSERWHAIPEDLRERHHAELLEETRWSRILSRPREA
jgi:hypothetical protein